MESFEHKGVWWLPEDPEKKYHGALSFDPINGGHLELVKPLGTSELPLGKSIDIIHGLAQGVLVTLQGCYVTRATSGEAKIAVDYIYKGRHFDKIEDIVFEELSVSYTHLNNWMIDHSLNIFKRAMGESIHNVNVSYNQFKPLSISLNNNLDIRFHYHNTRSSSITGVSLENKARITITPQKKLHFDEYYLFFNFHLPDFLTLATGQTNYPFGHKGYIRQPSTSEHLLSDSRMCR